MLLASLSDSFVVERGLAHDHRLLPRSHKGLVRPLVIVVQDPEVDIAPELVVVVAHEDGPVVSRIGSRVRRDRNSSHGRIRHDHGTHELGDHAPDRVRPEQHVARRVALARSRRGDHVLLLASDAEHLQWMAELLFDNVQGKEAASFRVQQSWGRRCDEPGDLLDLVPTIDILAKSLFDRLELTCNAKTAIVSAVAYTLKCFYGIDRTGWRCFVVDIVV